MCQNQSGIETLHVADAEGRDPVVCIVSIAAARRAAAFGAAARNSGSGGARGGFARAFGIFSG